MHGYEFGTSPDGTLLDTLMKQSPQKDVAFQMDVFWVMRGGGNPAALLTKYPGRFQLMHLKDIAKGTALGDPTGWAPDETSVPLGQGQVDWPAVLKAANGGRHEDVLHRGRAPEGGGPGAAHVEVSGKSCSLELESHSAYSAHGDADLR